MDFVDDLKAERYCSAFIILQMRMTAEEFARLRDAYEITYSKLADFDSMTDAEIEEYLLGEIAADSYAGMNDFAFSLSGVSEEVRGAVGEQVENLSHFGQKQENGTIAAVPAVIKRGIEIGAHDNHKGRSKHTITFAAPVVLNGIRGNMAVVVNKRGNKYYAHRIVAPDGKVFSFKNKDAVRELPKGVTVSGSLAKATSTTSIGKIPQEKQKIKGSMEGKTEKNSRDVENEDSGRASAEVPSIEGVTERQQRDIARVLRKVGTKYASRLDTRELLEDTAELYKAVTKGNPDMPINSYEGMMTAARAIAEPIIENGRFFFRSFLPFRHIYAILRTIA